MCIRDRQYTAGKGKEFYNQYFRLVTKWYETVGIGRTGGDIYREVGKLRDHMGIQLNMGHQIHTNEWILSLIHILAGCQYFKRLHSPIMK